MDAPNTRRQGVEAEQAPTERARQPFAHRAIAAAPATAPNEPPARLCTDAARFQTARSWVVVETTVGPDDCSMVLDGSQPRAFSKLTRASISRARTTSANLAPLIWECVESRQTRDRSATLPDGRAVHMLAVPVLGPSGHVDAAAVWAGYVTEQPPTLPVVGVIEWNPAGIATATSAANYLLRLPPGAAFTGLTLPEILAAAHHWDDRTGFLSLFNLAAPADRWTGTLTSSFDDGSPRQLHLAARVTNHPTQRTIRAVVCDITGNQQPQIHPDPCAIAVRHMPIADGHAVALVDLKSGFVHEWLTAPDSPLAGWRHHNPEFHPDDQLLIAQLCFELAAGSRQHANLEGRVRFADRDEWIDLKGKWTRISDGERPQALLDITPLAPDAALIVPRCHVCQHTTKQPGAYQ